MKLLQKYLPQGKIVDEGPLYHQQPYFLAYRTPAGSEAQIVPSHQIEANWNNKIQLLGYDLDASTCEAGEAVKTSSCKTWTYCAELDTGE